MKLSLWLLVVCLYSDGCRLATSKEVFPCQNQVENFTISVYSGVETVTIPADLSLCQNASWSTAYNGFRITTRIIESDGDYINSSKPVVFVARQPESDGIVSWNVPVDLQLNGTWVSQQYLSISHTMCPFKYDNETWAHTDLAPLPVFYIDTFTHSEKSITYSIVIEPEQDFMISATDGSFSTIVTPPSPQVFYYKIPDEYEIVTVEVTNTLEAVGCIFVSVQNNTCPFNDLLQDTNGRGIYQTMTESAFLTIEAKWVERREFLLILAPANYSICHDPPLNDTTLSLFLAHGQKVNIKVGSSQPLKKYLMAIFTPVLISFAVVFVSSLAVCSCWSSLCQIGCVLIQCKRIRETPCYVCIPCYSKGPCKCICCIYDSKRNDNFDRSSCNLHGPCVCLCLDFSQHNRSDDVTCCGDDNDDNIIINAEETAPLLRSDEHSDSDNDNEPQERAGIVDPQSNSGVVQIQQGDQTDLKDRKRYLEYGWNTMIVGIFYSLPAFQLIFFQQRLLDQSGDQDMCYYNFMCAHLAWPGISAFNNVWSNICYCLLGIAFCAIVLYRHCQYRRESRDPNTKKYLESHGVEQCFGIYYALGIALVLEGFMSSFYHICPSNANFQFDTAFMFIIGGLLLVKVFQNRHPHVNASAFVAFFCFALIIFFTVVGIYNDRNHPLAIKLSFLSLVVVIILPFIFISFYAIKYFRRKLLKKIENTKCGEIKHHICKWYTLKHAFVILVNIGVAIGMVVKNKDIGIATVVLICIVMNVVLYLVLYFVSKILNREPLTVLALILPVLIGLSWIGAFHFYGTVTEWSKPPAESRAMNKKCSLFEFYDKHDIWHMLSAFGMFFSFLFVLVIDDGVANWERKKLKIF